MGQRVCAGLIHVILGEAGEVGVEGADGDSVLDGQSGQMSVRDEVSAELAVDDQPGQDLGVPVAGMWNPGLVGVQPVGDIGPRLARTERIRERSWMRDGPLSARSIQSFACL